MSSAVSANDGAESAYRDIKTKVTALRADNKARRFRHSYEKLIRQFEGFIKKHPKTERTDDALFMTARLWDELARMSELKVDRQQAQRAYKQLRKRYPQSSLVDDALFKAAKLKMDLDADRVGTLAMLEQIINMGRSRADMYAQAQDYKKALQKKNDIEKPVLATSGQGNAVVVPSPETVAKKQNYAKWSWIEKESW